MTDFVRLLVALFRQIDDDTAVSAPWIAWGQHHPVRLHYTAFAPDETAYVMRMDDGAYTVVASRPFMDAALATVGGTALADLRDTDIALLMAWLKADLSDRQ